MRNRSSFLVLCCALGGCAAAVTPGTRPSAEALVPERAVRRDLPMPRQFRDAYRAGTRDSSGAPGRNYWQQRVDYRIAATVDPATNRVSGRETITLHNTTPDTLRTVVLRLYQNFFTPTVTRDDYVTDLTDGVTIESLSVNGSRISLSDRRQYALTERIAVVTPPAPILPGATATLGTAWRFTVPHVDTTTRGQRMGRYGNYLYQVAQWYPQVAMYDDIHGWDTDQYLGNAEFNNQFGSFDVRITAPGGWLLGATGMLMNPDEVYSARTRERLALAMRVDTTVHVVEADERGSSATARGATLTWHFTAPMVNDFAFAVSRDYVLDATHATIPGKGVIPVTALYLPQHTAYRTSNTAQFGRQALEQHSRFLFPYEFSQGTIADGPERGMEYPMIIFNGSSLGVTVHEFGHQWFPMMVGSNETRYGWMDEGLDEYITPHAIARITNSPLDFGNRARSYRRIAGSELEAPMMWTSEYAGPEYSVQAYSKLPVALNALGGIVGDSAVNRGLAEYAVKWKFRHPTPYDFFFSMNNSLGQDLDWFWYEWFFTANTSDQSIEKVSVVQNRIDISIRDRGDMVAPIILRLDFTDGSTEHVSRPADIWFSGSRVAMVSLSKELAGRRLKTVVLDPENRFQDVDRSNNSWQQM